MVYVRGTFLVVGQLMSMSFVIIIKSTSRKTLLNLSHCKNSCDVNIYSRSIMHKAAGQNETRRTAILQVAAQTPSGYEIWREICRPKSVVPLDWIDVSNYKLHAIS